MRDKYIELIKEYIKQKPEYELALDELKAEVLKVGATEVEFEEAIRQITEPSIQEDASLTSRSLEKALKLARFTKFHLETRKKYVAVISLTLIIITIASLNLNNNLENKKIAKVTKIEQTTATSSKLDKNPISVVYANALPIDAQKVFSIPFKNILLTVNGKPKKEVLGFFPYWMIDKQDKIDLSALSSISLFGLEADGKGNIIIQKNDGQIESGWSMWKNPNTNTLIKRAKNQGVNVYLTIKSFDDSNIESLSTSDDAQKAFITNVLFLVNSKNLDGVNIDFEYLGGFSDTIRDGFTRLITNLKAELKRQIPGSTLSVDTYLVSGSEQGIFDIPALSNQLDYFVIMGYDMHTPSGKPGPVSAMGGDTNIIGYVQNYLEKTTPNKLVLAVPYYGYDWLTSAKDNPSKLDTKIIPYAEIADASKNLQLSWDETSQTPFITYKENGVERVVHFDNVRSLAIKYDFINSKNLKGVGLWALGYDGQNQDLEKLLIDKFINN